MSAERPSSPPRDQIADLEKQLRELQLALSEERKRRQEERDSAAARERLLQRQLKDQEQSSPKKSKSPNLVPRVAGLRKATTATSPPAERNLGQITPRTADNLFVAMPDDSRTSTPRSTPRGVNRSQTAGRAQTAHSPGSPNSSPNARKPETAAERRQTTALQHAWNKFCVKASGEFKPQELALVSAETLDELLTHYGVNDAVEKAQVEAQWALLQEGKDTVGENATKQRVRSQKRGPLHLPTHPTEFVVEMAPPKKSLSRRTPLRDERPRPSNPNDTTSASPHIRITSGTVPLTPRSAAASNPNETQTTSPAWRSCAGRTQSPASRKSPARGMMHVQGPVSGEFTPRGRYADGGISRQGGDAARPQGIRCNNEIHTDPSGNKRGIRTFDGQHSPTRVPRPSKIVSTPPHVERARLGTETLYSSPSLRRREPLESLQRRTPFALDLPSQSANARAQRQ